MFERQVEQVGFVLFNTHTRIALSDVRHSTGRSQVRVLLVPALQPPARNTLGTGKFISHRRETRPGRTQTLWV